jgi:hypothetical protein
MADWDEDSERLRANIVLARSRAGDHALQRRLPTLEDPRNGHRQIMRRLAAPAGVIERFRGNQALRITKSKLTATQVLLPNERRI